MGGGTRRYGQQSDGRHAEAADSKRRKRVLNDVEIRKIWRELPISSAKSPICHAFQARLVTCARVGEVAGMTKDELDLRGEMQWRIPGDRTKNGFDHVVR